MFRFIPIFLILITELLFPQGRVVINEFMASNKNSAVDPKYLQNSDWLEVFNDGDLQINLKGFSITDDLSDPLKWKIEMNLILMPGQHYVIWCDDYDTLNHTSFGLSADGEQLGIFYPDGTPADTLTFGPQLTDISYGRFPDGGNYWVYYNNPTPGKMNDTVINKEIVSNPVFSMKSGFYSGTQTITLQHTDPAVKIHYSTDGSAPTDTSKTYNGPITISKTTVLRAAGYKTDCIPSKVVTNTYLIDETTTLPVVSISTDPANLFDDRTGIYVEGTNGVMGYCAKAPRNWNQDWERPIHLEFFEKDRTLGFELDAGIKIGGGCTRLYPQKPLAIFTRSSYGDSKIKYQLFPDKKIKEFNNIALRNSGQDWYRTLIRDGLIQNIVKDQMDIDRQAYRAGIVFLNGTYWGIYDIREKHNEHYIAANHKLDPDSIEMASGYVDKNGNITEKEGSADHFIHMIKYMETHDLSQDEYYDYITTQMDIDEYINYYIIQIFFGNADWPGGNIKFWRPKGTDGKWRWILFDTDMAFGAHGQSQYDINNLYLATSVNNDYYANPARSTLQFRSLLKNAGFRNSFIQRFAYHLNTTFNTERILCFIDSMKNEIASEIPRHVTNKVVINDHAVFDWVRSCSYDRGSWESNFEILYEYAEKRHGYVRNHFNEKFNLSGSVYFTIINEGPGGKIYFDGIELKPDTLKMIMFKDVPLKLSVSAREGFRFKGWKGISESTSPEISVILNGTSTLIAEFEKIGTDVNDNAIAYTFALDQNYPNPFNPNTIINYQLPQSGHATLKLYDLLGKEVAVLVDETLTAGPHSLELSAQGISSGIYFYQLKSGPHTASKKMIILK